MQKYYLVDSCSIRFLWLFLRHILAIVVRFCSLNQVTFNSNLNIIYIIQLAWSDRITADCCVIRNPKRFFSGIASEYSHLI